LPPVARFANWGHIYQTPKPSSPAEEESLLRKQKGFSLIELLIVVTIILIIAAIAIPNLVRARISVNEAAAASSVRTSNATQVTYQSTYPTMGYANSIAALGPPASTGCPARGPGAANACLIDFGLASATVPAAAKTGYYFGMGVPAGSPPDQGYTVGGAPAGFNQTGVRGFCSNARTKMA
jgi:prepilin-type N-terminal cleavage/methylation domain-containing protein